MLFCYLAAMKPLIAQRWTMGEDFGVRQDPVDRGIAEIGLTRSVQAAYQVIDDQAGAEARAKRAFSSVVGGAKLDELLGGYGVAHAGLAAMARLGMPAAETRAVVQVSGRWAKRQHAAWPRPA